MPGTANRTCCTASTWWCSRARWSRCWAATAPGAPPRCAPSWASPARARAASRSTAPRPSACRRTASRTSASATAPRSAASSPACRPKRTCCCRRALKGARQGHVGRRDLRHVSQPGRAPQQPGHAPVGRRAADAGGGAHPAHRRQAAAARRDLRRPGAGDRAGAGAHDPHAARQGLHHRDGRAELPLRRAAGRPLLRDGARPHRRDLRRRPNSTPRCRCSTNCSASESAQLFSSASPHQETP